MVWMAIGDLSVTDRVARDKKRDRERQTHEQREGIIGCFERGGGGTHVYNSIQ